MHSFDLFFWVHQLLAPSNGVVLWVSISLLLLAVAFWAQRRSMAARARSERARREAERQELGGDSFFMPLPAIEQAVEIANPVEIDSLLNGESETVAGRARELLSAPTGVSTSDGMGDLPFVLGSVPLAPVPGHARQTPLVAATKRTPVVPFDPPPATIAIAMNRPTANAPSAASSIPTPLPTSISASIPAPVSAPVPAPIPTSIPIKPAPRSASALPFAIPVSSAPAPTNIGAKEGATVPVRDLVLTWFEARGYRASAVSVQFRPIELELRHRTDPDRNYAFVVERDRVTATRANALLALARAAGHTRVLIAAEAGSDDVVAQDLRRRGIRVFDQSSIRVELEKVDIRIAAKIIAVAGGRNLARQSKPATSLRASPLQAEVPAGI